MNDGRRRLIVVKEGKEMWIDASRKQKVAKVALSGCCT